jgi:hypothetical protein
MNRPTLTHGLLAAAVVATVSLAGAPTANAAQQPTCGSVVTHNVRLTGNLVCPADGLIVDGAGTITIDLNGFAIKGAGTGTGLDIRNSTQVRVKDGAINGFGTALMAESPATLTDLTFCGNTATGGPFVGSDVVASAPIVARRLTGTGSAVATFHTGSRFANVKFASMVLFGLRDSTITNSEIGSILTHDAFNIELRRDVLGHLGVLQSDGFQIVGNDITTLAVAQSRGTTISGNRFRGADVALAFDPLGSQPEQPNLIQDNLFDGNNFGIVMGSALAGGVTTISGNHFRNNASAGLYADVQQGTATVTISDNSFVANGGASSTVDSTGSAVDDGLHVVAGGAIITVVGNRANRNTDLGIEAVGVIDGGGNTARRNGNAAQCVGVVCS